MTIRKLWYIFNKKQKLQFAGLFVIEFIGSLFELLGVSMLIPFLGAITEPAKLMKNVYIRPMIELLGIQHENQLIIFIVGAMIAVFMLKNLYLVFMTYTQYQIIWKNRLQMEIDVMAYYVRQPYVFHVRHNTAEMQRTILTDIGNVFAVVDNVFLMVSEILTSAMLFLLMIVTDTVVTLAVMTLLAAFILLYFKVFKIRLQKYGEISQYYGAEGLKCINQIFGGIKEIKVNQSENYFIKEFQDGRKIQVRMMKRGAFFQQTPKYVLEMVVTCGILGMVFVKLCIGVEVSQLLMQLGVFAVAAYRILPSANRMTAQLAYVFNNKASIDLIYQAFINDQIDLKKKKRKNTKKKYEETDKRIDRNMGDIKLENVTFHYPESERKILDGVSIGIKGGESTAFKGPSGTGKTTTADLILGILEPTCGKISYNDTNIKELGGAWYEHIGYIPQNIYLSDDTIRKNVIFGREDLGEAKIWQAIEDAQLKEFVESLPDGLESKIGENGVRISGGQRQRIGIARALYGNPEILILDEATSALDGETEKAVMESIDYLKGKKTLIIIAHRLSTIENCDVIYEVRDGNVKQEAVLKKDV